MKSAAISAITGTPCAATNHGANSTGCKLETKFPASTLFGASSGADVFADNDDLKVAGLAGDVATDETPLPGATSMAMGVVARVIYWRVSGSK